MSLSNLERERTNQSRLSGNISQQGLTKEMPLGSLSTAAISIAYFGFTVLVIVSLVTGWLPAWLDFIGLKSYPEIWAFVGIVFLGAIAAMLPAAAQGVLLSIGTVTSFIALTLNQEPLVRYLTLGAVLFAIGMYGMVVSRNAVRLLMSIELMLNAANINLIAFTRYIDPIHIKGQVFAVFVLTIAAAEAVVGLAIVLAIYRNTATIDMERFNLLKW